MDYIHYKEKDTESYIKEYELDGIAECFLNLEYDSKSGSNKLDLYLPLERNVLCPVIIYIHGGGLLRGDKTRHIGPMLQGLRYGYGVACINYRLCDEAPFPAMMHDVTNGIKYLKKNALMYGIDPDKLILWGETHGAYLACLTGVYGKTGVYDDPNTPYPGFTSEVNGVIDYWSFTDFESAYRRSLQERMRDGFVLEEKIFWKSGKELEDEIRKYPSILDGITGTEPPFYILHSELDHIIPRDDSIRLYEAMKSAGDNVYFELVPDTEHGLPNYRTGAQLEGTYRFIHTVFSADKE